MKLRNKLLLSALVLLLMPISTVRFLRSLDKWLVSREQIHLSEKVQSLSSGLSPFISHWETERSLTEAKLVFPIALETEVILDGFENEWEASSNNWNKISGSTHQFLIGKFNDYFLLFIKSAINPKDFNEMFQYELSFSQNSDFNNLQIKPQVPGKILATSASNILQSRVQGFWYAGENQVSLELRIPADLVTKTVKLEVTTGTDKNTSNWLELLIPVQEQQQLLDSLKVSFGERIWLLGTQGEVLGSKGELIESLSNSDNPFLNWLIGTAPRPLEDPWLGVSQLSGSWLDEAQKSGWATRILAGSNRHQRRMIAVARIGNIDNPSGFMVYEKITGTNLLLSQPQVGLLLNMSLGLMLVTIVIFLLFGGKLSLRIRRLQRQLTDSLDRNGRVINLQNAGKSKDELGQLSREVRKLLGRQKGYQDYQERLASRLSHELRTPMAVVRGALDNLKANHQPINSSESNIQYENKNALPGDSSELESSELIERGLVGIERLSSIVSRMREAARLEEVIYHSRCVATDLQQLVKQITQGLASVWPDYYICFETPPEIFARANVAPDLIAQALEKLVSNAVDFSEPSTSNIAISVTQVASTLSTSLSMDKGRNQFKISVSNIGSLLPEGSEHQLTENMVSIRNAKQNSNVKSNIQNEPHLGLGLYMVGLIAKFHHGKVLIANRPDKNGVISEFTVVS